MIPMSSYCRSPEDGERWIALLRAVHRSTSSPARRDVDRWLRDQEQASAAAEPTDLDSLGVSKPSPPMTPDELEALMPKFHGPKSAARLLGISYTTLLSYRRGRTKIPMKIASK